MMFCWSSSNNSPLRGLLKWIAFAEGGHAAQVLPSHAVIQVRAMVRGLVRRRGMREQALSYR